MNYMWGKKRIIFITILFGLFGLFKDEIEEKIWILKNQNKVFCGLKIGNNKDRIYYNGEEKFGIILDIFNEVEKRYGIKIEPTEDSSKKDFTAFFNLSKEVRSQDFLYTDPYLESKQLFYSKNKIRKLKEIKGLKIISDDLTEDVIDDLSIKKFKNVNSYSEKLKKFKKEEYDGLILNEEILREQGGNETLRQVHEVFLPPIYNINMGMKISKEKKYLFSIINKTIKDLNSSGELDKIIITNSIKLKRKHIKLTEKEQKWLKGRKKLKIDVVEDRTLKDLEKILGNKRDFTSKYLNDLFSPLGIKIILSHKNPDMTSIDKILKGYKHTKPLYSYNIFIYGQNKVNLAGLIDLEGEKVGVFKGSKGEKYLEENLLKNKTIPFKTFKEMANALQKK